MNEQTHDDESDTSITVVRALLQAECPRWATKPTTYLQTTGTSNSMWRVHLEGESDVVVRLPRTADAGKQVAHEINVLQQVRDQRIATLIRTPMVRHVGEPHPAFPHDWSILEWIDGVDLWSVRNDLSAEAYQLMAYDLGEVARALTEVQDVDAQARNPGARGGPLLPMIEGLHWWLDHPQWHARDLIDVPAIKRLIDQSLEVADQPFDTTFVHGDLIPGNLLVNDQGRISAVIDWGGVGVGDPAQDLSPAWSVFEPKERAIFRKELGVDEPTWIRGRLIELQHAVAAVLYYVPRDHPLGTVMSRTLERLLTDA